MRAVSKAELARLAGVSKPAVTKAAASFLAPAMVGKKIDIDHALVAEWIDNKRNGKTKRTAPAPKKAPPPHKPKSAKKKPTPRKSAKKKPPATVATPKPKDDPPPRVELPEDEAIKNYGDMTLKVLVAKFGTGAMFKDWTSAKKMLEEIRYKQLTNEQKEGELISRELVKLHVFGAMENTNLRLLTDTPKTITKRLQAHFKAGGTLEESEEIVRKILGTQLKNIKATARRVLDSA